MFAELLRFRSWRIAVILSRNEDFPKGSLSGTGASSARGSDEIPLMRRTQSQPSAGACRYSTGRRETSGKGKFFVRSVAVAESACMAYGSRFGRGVSLFVFRSIFPSDFPFRLFRGLRRGLSKSFLAMGFSREVVFLLPSKALRISVSSRIFTLPILRKWGSRFYNQLNSQSQVSPPPSHCTSSSSPPCGWPALP